jgi:hypothetical protein
VAERARDASVVGKTLCLATHDGALEIWDLQKDVRLHQRKLPANGQTLAAPGACFTLAGENRELSLHRADGSARRLVDGVIAISPDQAGLLAAREREVLVFGTQGARRKRYSSDIGVRAMLRTRDWLVLGFKDGNIELSPLTGRQRPTFSFEKVPSSAVVRLLEGPMGTLIAGFANGVLGIWNLDNGARLHHIRLHGPVIHLLRREGKLYAATELGQSHVLDLGIFHTGYCNILRSVWGHVPAVWEGGLPLVRPPPPGHRCRW